MNDATIQWPPGKEVVQVDVVKPKKTLEGKDLED